MGRSGYMISLVPHLFLGQWPGLVGWSCMILLFTHSISIWFGGEASFWTTSTEHAVEHLISFYRKTGRKPERIIYMMYYWSIIYYRSNLDYFIGVVVFVLPMITVNFIWMWRCMISELHLWLLIYVLINIFIEHRTTIVLRKPCFHGTRFIPLVNVNSENTKLIDKRKPRWPSDCRKPKRHMVRMTGFNIFPFQGYCEQ